jgi:DMSO/TMAO reductase YedYZ heme-binding membrane subunit
MRCIRLGICGFGVAQKATAVMVLGYLLMGLVLVCVVSGLVLTWQSWFGPKIGQTWHLIHLVSGFAALVLVAVHLPLALMRRRHLAAATPRFRRGVRRHVAGVLGTVLASAVLLGLVAFRKPSRPRFVFSELNPVDNPPKARWHDLIDSLLSL